MTQKFGRESRLFKAHAGGLKMASGGTRMKVHGHGQHEPHAPPPMRYQPPACDDDSCPPWETRSSDGHRFGFTAHDDCRPRRTLQERHQSRAAAEQFLASYKRQPSKSEVDGLANSVYKSVYPGGPYPIPSASHPCAKSWLAIRVLINKRLKAAANPKVGKKRGSPRRRRNRSRARRFVAGARR